MSGRNVKDTQGRTGHEAITLNIKLDVLRMFHAGQKLMVIAKSVSLAHFTTFIFLMYSI